MVLMYVKFICSSHLLFCLAKLTITKATGYIGHSMWLFTDHILMTAFTLLFCEAYNAQRIYNDYSIVKQTKYTKNDFVFHTHINDFEILVFRRPTISLRVEHHGHH